MNHCVLGSPVLLTKSRITAVNIIVLLHPETSKSKLTVSEVRFLLCNLKLDARLLEVQPVQHCLDSSCTAVIVDEVEVGGRDGELRTDRR